MSEFFRKLFGTLCLDVVFCLSILTLCFNPYADMTDFGRKGMLFIAFMFYLSIPRILHYEDEDDIFNALNFSKFAEQKELFVATISHDLKAPALSQIASLNTLLKEDLGRLNFEQKNIVKAILNSCIYMKELILMILTTYKFANGAIPLKYEGFDILELTDDCIKEIKGLAKDKKLTFKVSSQIENTSIISADELQIKRVIMNLLANSISYAYKNSEIRIDIINEKGFLRFYMENSSPYIPDDILRQLFKKYASFSSKYTKAGFGLGLYLSRRIVEAHGGNIQAESFTNNKNVFSFYIPSYEAVDAETRKTADGGEGRVTF